MPNQPEGSVQVDVDAFEVEVLDALGRIVVAALATARALRFAPVKPAM